MTPTWTGIPGSPVPPELRHDFTYGPRCVRCGQVRGFVLTELCAPAVARRLAELEAAVRAAKDRLDAAEARADAIEERVATADMPWRLPGCQCPADSKPADRCDSRWTRCNARLQYQRAVKANGGPS